MCVTIACLETSYAGVFAFLHFVVYLIRLLRSTVKDATRIERKKRIDLLQHEDSLRVLQTTLDYFTIKLVEPLDVYALSLGTLFCIEQSEWMCSEPFTEWVFNRPETIAALSGFFFTDPRPLRRSAGYDEPFLK